MATPKSGSGSPRVPKTLKDLSAILDLGSPSNRDAVSTYLKNAKDGHLIILENLKLIDKTFKTEKERLVVYKELLRLAKIYTNEDSKLQKELDKQVKKREKILELQENQKKVQESIVKTLKTTASKALDDIIKKNQEIYNVSHKMQLEGNLTWRQFTALYNQTYDAARTMNAEIGKQLINVKDLVHTQNVMLGSGWRSMSTSQLGSLSTQIALMTKTLGEFPPQLHTAFQMSFRQFGDTTYEFVNSMGNRLNVFSDTFGITVQTLSNNIADMMAATSFLARNNMQAQVRANESIMRATALSSQVGILTTNFLNNLAKTAQFGTATQMSELYQAGAYLQGFSTYDFQQQLMNQDYEGATSDLISSIYNTLSGMESGYLRNEYMSQIGSGFGLSQDDILQIMANGNNLTEYSTKIQEKLVDVNTSMEDELKDLKVTLIDQLSNLWENSGLSQGIGSLMNETGLYGLMPAMNTIIGLMGLNVTLTSGKTVGQALLGKIGGMFSSSGAIGVNGVGILGGQTAGAIGMSGLAKLGLGTAGVGIGVGSNMLGRGMIADPNQSQAGGWATNILGGAAGGALTGLAIGGGVGAAIGAGIGLMGGIVNSYSAEQERQQALKASEEASRVDRAQQRSQTISTGDPVVDAINRQTDVLAKVFSSEFTANRNMTLTIDALNKNKAPL